MAFVFFGLTVNLLYFFHQTLQMEIDLRGKKKNSNSQAIMNRTTNIKWRIEENQSSSHSPLVSTCFSFFLFVS